MNFILKKAFLFVGMLAFSLLLTACSSSSSGPATTNLTGTAATGAPLTGTVTVTGSQGNTATTTTNADGSFSVDVSDLTPPFILEADDGAGTVLYSYAAVADITVNITPLTDLAMYIANSSGDPANLFNNWSSTFSSITNTDVQDAQAVVNANLSGQFSNSGLDANTYDFFGTVFTANGSGFDGLLDSIIVDTSSGITVSLMGGGPLSFSIMVDVTGITIGGGGSGGGTGGGASGTYTLVITGTALGISIPSTTINDLPAAAVPTSSAPGTIEQEFNNAFGAIGSVSNVMFNITSETATETIATFSATINIPPAGAIDYNLVYTYTQN